MLKAGRRSVRRKTLEAHVHPVWLALLLILSLAPSTSAHAQTLRPERPTLTVGEKWIRSDGAYELVRIEGNTYVFAAGSGREVHLNRDLHIVRTRRGVDIVVSNQAHPDWAAGFAQNGYAVLPDKRMFAPSPALRELMEPFAQTARGLHLTNMDGHGPMAL